MLYVTPAEAFALSGCTDRDHFYKELNRLLSDGLLPSASRRNEPGSRREITPPFTWVDCDISLLGEAVSKRPERLRPEHRHAARGPYLLGEDGRHGCLPIDRIDVCFLREDFVTAWKMPEPLSISKLSGRLAALGISMRGVLSFLTVAKHHPTPKEEEEITLFLQERQHGSIKCALEDTKRQFPRVYLNEKTIAQLRKELGLKGARGRKPGN